MDIENSSTKSVSLREAGIELNEINQIPDLFKSILLTDKDISEKNYQGGNNRNDKRGGSRYGDRDNNRGGYSRGGDRYNNYGGGGYNQGQRGGGGQFMQKARQGRDNYQRQSGKDWQY